MGRLFTIIGAIVSALVVGLGTPTPALAECLNQTNKFPRFTVIARSADTVLIGTVVEELRGHEGTVATFRLRVDEVLRGDASDRLDIVGLRSGLPLKGSPACRENAFLYAQVGDVLAIALDGRLEARDGVNTAAWIEGRPSTKGAQSLTKAAARRAAGARVARADQEADARTHPIVGSWVAENSENTYWLISFSADGTVRGASQNGPSMGAWIAAGDRTADTTLRVAMELEAGTAGLGTIRGSVEVSADGQSFTATYTLELPEGADSGGQVPQGELGPVAITGVRIAVEPMGDPVGPVPSEMLAAH